MAKTIHTILYDDVLDGSQGTKVPDPFAPQMERKDEEALFKFLTPNGMEKTVRLKRTN